MKSEAAKANCLPRVEGGVALPDTIKGERMADLNRQLFEPSRLFEAVLRGRTFSEAPDITTRISGIYPVAHQMSACHAMEDAFGMNVQGPIRDLRRFLFRPRLTSRST